MISGYVSCNVTQMKIMAALTKLKQNWQRQSWHLTFILRNLEYLSSDTRWTRVTSSLLKCRCNQHWYVSGVLSPVEIGQELSFGVVRACELSKLLPITKSAIYFHDSFHSSFFFSSLQLHIVECLLANHKLV